MGAIHSNSSRDEERNAQDLRQAQNLAAKLFAMDIARSPVKQGPSKPHKGVGSHISPANRRSIVRILESMHRDTDKRDGRSQDVTANSTCDNSPIVSYSCRPISKEHVKDAQFGKNQQSFGLRKISRCNSFNQSMDLSISRNDIDCDLGDSNAELPDAISPAGNGARSRRIPVKGRRVGPAIISSDNSHHNEEDLDDENPDLHLKQIYDLRTWEMYLRITESRKNKPHKKAVHIPMTQKAPIPHVNGGFPLWQQPGMCVGMNPMEQPDSYCVELLPPWSAVPEHEMIFGDLDD